MTLSEIPADLQQAMTWVVRWVQAGLSGLPPLLGDLWRSVVQSVRGALSSALPALSGNQRDNFVVVAVVVGALVIAFLMIELLLLLVSARRGTPNHLRHRHQ